MHISQIDIPFYLHLYLLYSKNNVTYLDGNMLYWEKLKIIWKEQVIVHQYSGCTQVHVMLNDKVMWIFQVSSFLSTLTSVKIIYSVTNSIVKMFYNCYYLNSLNSLQGGIYLFYRVLIKYNERIGDRIFIRLLRTKLSFAEAID